MPQDYIEIMRIVLSRQSNPESNSKISSRSWILLPGLCCAAAGGEASWAEDVSAAWYVFYAAAHLMDKIEDIDYLDSSWEAISPGVLLNAASGLYFSASLTLSNLFLNPVTALAAHAVEKIFFENFLVMSVGQHRDLVSGEPNLDQYWDIASEKSGAFFGLACHAGARLAVDNQNLISVFKQYGYHLGMLIQILDDLEDIFFMQEAPERINQVSLCKSLAVVFALGVLTGSEKERLRICLKDAHANNEARAEMFELLDKSGSVIYILAEIEKHRKKAIESIQKASICGSEVEPLVGFVQELVHNYTS